MLSFLFMTTFFATGVLDHSLATIRPTTPKPDAGYVIAHRWSLGRLVFISKGDLLAERILLCATLVQGCALVTCSLFQLFRRR